MLQRLTKRGEMSGRADDQEETIRKRIASFQVRPQVQAIQKIKKEIALRPYPFCFSDSRCCPTFSHAVLVQLSCMMFSFLFDSVCFWIWQNDVQASSFEPELYLLCIAQNLAHHAGLIMGQ